MSAKKILIVSLKAGAGHIKAAEALEIAAKQNKNLIVKNIDLLDYASQIIRFQYGKMYLDIVKNAPLLYAHSYKNYQQVKKYISPKPLIDAINLKKFFDVIDDFNPDILLSTHFIPPLIAGEYKKGNNKKYSITTLMTDYEYHPLWHNDYTNIYCVATEEIKFGLASEGISAGKIKITGIPVHPLFAQKQNISRLRKKHGLKTNKKTVLISAGSFGMTPIDELVQKIQDSKIPSQLLIVCGKNQKLADKLKTLQKKTPCITKIFGFTDEMHELMAISDLIITKPGGLTVTESLVSALPMVLIEPIPGQEEANADYVIENGAGIKARSLSSLIYKLNLLVKNPAKLRQMKDSAGKISKPNAARDCLNAALKSSKN